MSAKVVMYQPPPNEAEKPPRFYLKKWLIVIIASLSVLYLILSIVILIAMLFVDLAEYNKGGSNPIVGTINLKAFLIIFLIFAIISAIFEAIGAIGAYKERLVLVRYYFYYIIASCVLNLVTRIIALSLAAKQQDSLGNSASAGEYAKLVINVIFTALFVALVFYYMLDLKSIREDKRTSATPEEAVALKA